VLPLFAQDMALDAASSVKVELPSDSPLTLIGSAMGESRATTRGGALVLDLHMSVTLRNAGFRRVRGVTLLVTAQEQAPGGKGSVARPSIDVPPSQEFTVPIDIRLVRPIQAGGGPLVRVQLDGVIFDDLSFFGPNKLNSQRTMTFWETEAQRDRAYYRRVLQAKGEKGLRDEILSRAGRESVAVNRGAPSDRVAVAVLATPSAPVEVSDTPNGLQLVNRSRRPVRYVEMGWIVKDREGNAYPATPVAGTAVALAPGEKSKFTPDTALAFSRSGKPVETQAITGFVKHVEFNDGRVWVPAREDMHPMSPSPEEQRLADVYTKKGIASLVADLNRY